MVYISINVENGKIEIKDSFDLGLYFEKVFPIEPSGDNPLHKQNIEEIRINYNGIRGLFKVYVSPTSQFSIHLKAKIHKCEILGQFIDVYCIDQEEHRDKINELSINDDKKGVELYFRNLLGNEIIDKHLEETDDEE